MRLFTRYSSCSSLVPRSQRVSNKWLALCGKCCSLSIQHCCTNFPEKCDQNYLFCGLERSPCTNQSYAQVAYDGLLCCWSCPLKLGISFVLLFRYTGFDLFHLCSWLGTQNDLFCRWLLLYAHIGSGLPATLIPYDRRIHDIFSDVCLV